MYQLIHFHYDVFIYAAINYLSQFIDNHQILIALLLSYFCQYNQKTASLSGFHWG